MGRPPLHPWHHDSRGPDALSLTQSNTARKHFLLNRNRRSRFVNSRTPAARPRGGSLQRILGFGYVTDASCSWARRACRLWCCSRSRTSMARRDFSVCSITLATALRKTSTPPEEVAPQINACHPPMPTLVPMSPDVSAKGCAVRCYGLTVTHILGPSRRARMTIAERFTAGEASRFSSRVPEGRLNRSTVPPGLGINVGVPPSHEWLGWCAGKFTRLVGWKSPPGKRSPARNRR